MSAPLTVNTKDGTCWTRRAATRGGLALYAPEGVCSCPEFVMATEAELAELGIVGSADVLPVKVGPVPQTLPAAVEGPALPWAASMDDSDLSMFLDDLVSAAMGRWRSEPEVPDRTVLADIEKVCADWRTPGQGLRGDAPEVSAPDAVTQSFAPVAAPRGDVSPQVEKLWNLLAGQRASLEDPHDGPLAHRYRLSHDLPELGGTS